jgi:hypothetical protein
MGYKKKKLDVKPIGEHLKDALKELEKRKEPKKDKDKPKES